MKTLSFHDYQIGYSRGKALLDLDSRRDSVSFKSGLQLIIAPNGYGKSTLLQTLGGIHLPLAGQAQFEEKFLDSEKSVLYLSEYLSFPKKIYPSEWITFFSKNSPDPVAGQTWVERFRLTSAYHRYLGTLSQGERRKVTWLAAHFSQKPVLLLDEPLDGLDLYGIDAARELIQKWKQEERMICIVAHQVWDLLDLADQVFLIKNQKLVHSPFDLRSLEFKNARTEILNFYGKGAS